MPEIGRLKDTILLHRTLFNHHCRGTTYMYLAGWLVSHLAGGRRCIFGQFSHNSPIFHTSYLPSLPRPARDYRLYRANGIAITDKRGS